MIFLKNLLMKKGIKRYLFTIFIVILFSLFLISLNNYMNNYKERIRNDIIKRTIIIADDYDCQIKINHISSCEASDEGYKIIVDDVDNLEKVAKELDKNYNILINEINDDNLGNIITFLQIISLLFFITCIIIELIMIIQFYKDDEKINRILRCIGYSKLKLYIINTFLLIVIFSIIYFIPYILLLIIDNIFVIDLELKILSYTYLLQYLVTIINIMVIYYIFLVSMKKNKLK